MGIFYVYEHWRPDRDECFYVGKGHGNRAHSLKRNNKHHKRIVNKLAKVGMCVEVRLVADGLDEIKAFEIEIARIKFWRSVGINLANKTEGGEGLKNPSKEVREKLSKSAKDQWANEESREKKSKAISDAKNTPEYKAKASKMRRAKWQEPEYRDQMIIALNDPEVSARKSKKLKENWAITSVRKKRSASAKAAKSKPEAIQAFNDWMTKYRSVPENKKKNAAAIKEAKNRPEEKERTSRKSKEVWQRPGHREKVSAKVSASITAWHAARRLNKMKDHQP